MLPRVRILVLFIDSANVLRQIRNFSQSPRAYQTANKNTIRDDKAFVEQLVGVLKSKKQHPILPFENSYSLAKDWSGKPILDPRSEALEVFQQYRHAVDGCPRDSIADNMRAPIAVNSGTTGSGKTVQLFLLCKQFQKEMRSGKVHAVYFTFNGDDSTSQNFDSKMPVATRVAHRILHAATGSKSSPASFWSGVRRSLGMVQAEDYISINRSDPAEESLTNAGVVLDACRQVLDLDDTEPLLIAADELAKLSKSHTVGETNDDAVAALKFLGGLSDVSVMRKNQLLSKKLPPSGLCYIAASAYTAYNPAKGVTEGSNRQVFFLPLPPVHLDKYDKSLLNALGWTARESKFSKKQQLSARTCLWYAQRNARGLTGTYNALMAAKPNELDGLFEESKKEVERDAHDQFTSLSDACSWSPLRPKPDPVNFIRTLFWPQGQKSTTAFHSNMHAALLAEAAGLCSILRENRMDRVYAHPTAARVICENLIQFQACDAQTKAMLGAVIELCKALEELPQLPGEDGSGKLYERVMLHYHRCRVMTAFKREITAAELLCQPRESALGSLIINTRDPIPVVPVKCFPRAAEPGKDVEEAKDQAACLPRSATIYEHRFNVVEDARLILGDVYIAIQCKEYKIGMLDSNVLAYIRKSRKENLDAAVAPFLSNFKQYVHVIATPNKKASWMLPNDQAEFDVIVNLTKPKGTEVLLTQEDILQVCPMVAYSGCDARVLFQVRPNQQPNQQPSPTQELTKPAN